MVASAILKNRRALFISLSALASLLPAAQTNAEGYRISPPGAFNLGRAGGRIAQVDDSSAVQQNPANLVGPTNAEIQLAPGVIYFNAHFDSSAAPGQSAETKDPWNFIPNIFASMPLDNGKIALGFGASTPYGLGVHWNPNSSAFTPLTGVLRYTSPYDVNLKTINMNPSVAMKLFDDKLQVGVGLDVMWSELTFKEFYPWFMLVPGSPDGHVKLDGDGVGMGGNLGITWNITDHQRLAVTYRSPIHIDYEGRTTIDNVPGGGTLSRSFSTSTTFPTIVALGYGIELPHNVRLESDFEWLEYSHFKNLPINTDPSLGLPNSAPENWHNSFTIGIGGDWQFADNWVLRAGYQFYKSPIPDNNLTPSIPDANNNVFTIGLGYKHGHHAVEAAYGANFYDTRTVSHDVTPAFNGKYGVTVHLISLAYHYSF